MATNLNDLINKVNTDNLPTNVFTIEDTDPMTLLGKLNEVIAYLQTLQDTINSSDSKASEALQKAIQAVADATQALSVANGIDDKATQALANAIEAVSTANTALSASNTALSTANTAISTANTSLSSANNAVETAGDALNSANRAENKADTAITTANGAKGTAESIDAKATTALENSQSAISTANTANSKAQEALNQVVSGLGTKIYRETTLLSTLDINPIEKQLSTNTVDIAELDTNKVSKVSGKQLSTEDFTTAEKNKLTELNNYDDTQIQADITTINQKITNLTPTVSIKTGVSATNTTTIPAVYNVNGEITNLTTITFDSALSLTHGKTYELYLYTYMASFHVTTPVMTLTGKYIDDGDGTQYLVFTGIYSNRLAQISRAYAYVDGSTLGILSKYDLTKGNTATEFKLEIKELY